MRNKMYLNMKSEMKRGKRMKQEGGKWIVWMESTSAALHSVSEETFGCIT